MVIILKYLVNVTRCTYFDNLNSIRSCYVGGKLVAKLTPSQMSHECYWIFPLGQILSKQLEIFLETAIETAGTSAQRRNV